MMNIVNYFGKKETPLESKCPKKVIDEVIWVDEWKRDPKEGGLIYLNE